VRVVRASVLGRCMGVRRAVELALETARRERGAPVYTIGPLIHNPQAVRELADEGVVAISEADLDGRVAGVASLAGIASLAGAAVVIRAHGVPPALRERLEALGARIVDATCPRVLASQRRARDFGLRGYSVVIAGDAGHGEVTGIAGYAPGAVVVGGPDEARVASLRPPVALIAQTTIKKEEYDAIRDALMERFPDLEVVDSICPCTGERLAALAELAGEVDAIVVVGGRNSANTARLLATARELGKPAWLVETQAELPDEIFGYDCVGLTAGASTPESIIDEVDAALKRGALYRGGAGV
jgi:4-hydroxy-3-methylbut-2-en-1-yl diphosphate reductase